MEAGFPHRRLSGVEATFIEYKPKIVFSFYDFEMKQIPKKIIKIDSSLRSESLSGIFQF